MQIIFYDLDIIDDVKLKYAVILTRYNNEWIYVKHKERQTWEIPGGKREPNEPIEETAKRELYEETGTQSFSLLPLFVYSVKFDSGDESYGGLYYSEVKEIGQLPAESEIGEVSFMKGLPSDLTYPTIQPELYNKALLKLSIRSQE
ncbi:NUDIX hydrolase [Paenibacillus sp. URB8-2]|uniref:NUDIX hydrolase n=1 Tax=Paenibacillus sp. URB8-2 TaxID=2741301 RepID=UPI0015BC17D5|nr:NUDIX domain-containing protein [Paenibacillus sp. URB8-2]BCG59441.1 DNA mismatch repair protein MutT [Paenibacillus sp. URB8-2]